MDTQLAQLCTKGSATITLSQLHSCKGDRDLGKARDDSQRLSCKAGIDFIAVVSAGHL